jgi:type IV secretion system protein VirB10
MQDERQQDQPRPTGGSWRSRIQNPEGALPKLKAIGAAALLAILGVALLSEMTCGTAPRKQLIKNAPASQQPMSPSAIASEEAQLQHEKAEAERQAQEAALARQRALETLNQGSNLQQAQQGAGAVSPDEQLRRQLRAERLKREAQAPYASSVAFAGKPPETHTAQNSSPEGPASAAADAEPPEALTRVSDTDAKKPPRITSVCDTEPSYDFATFCLPEGTVMETVLVNRLDSTYDGPVICQVSQDVYDVPTRTLLVPRGARVLGEAKQINSPEGLRVAVFFHVIVLPDGKRVSLDKFQGLDQVGESGLVSKINHHYVEIFGTSLALGAIGGLAQIGSYGGGGFSPWYGFRMGVTQQMAQSADRVLDKMLNKPATVIVKEGTRVKIITTADMRIPSYS